MRKIVLLIGLAVVVLAGGVFAAVFWNTRPSESPWDRLPPKIAHLDHAALVQGNFRTGQDVTAACLSCHPNAAKDVMKTSHWTWAGQKVRLPGRDEIMSVGKRNLINNFCIHAGPNIKKCSSCHVGYGWEDDSFDFTNEANVDCLICHEQTGTYQKGNAGNPEPSVDLLAVAKSVARPTRLNCGQCHFKGGGGDAVKHGDMDGSMYFPSERIDAHMGRHGLQCVDCHRTVSHQIPGCAMSVCIDRPKRVDCTNCHSEAPHHHDRLDAHTKTVACQTCHIPRMAIDAPTKMVWDWSEAGRDDRPEDPHVYLKAKGSFQYAQNVRPEYYWYNGRAYRYLTGDKIDPAGVVQINRPLGGPGDPEAKIWPFKIHRGKQVYDREHLYLLTPRTWGPGGYWTEFDWDKACRVGSETTGLPYSGQYDFVATEMYWPLSHMVQTKEKALQCNDCHGQQGVLDWQALGYEGDPAFRGDRRRTELIRGGKGESR
jgi:octaheme c-type cytochrome (tetrathionate reductase family)